VAHYSTGADTTEEACDSSPNLIEDLTHREYEILGMFAEGLQTKVVASRLSISEQTTRAHTKSIYRKLRVTNRVAAALAYLKQQEDHHDPPNSLVG
jgi:DNA-binding NarL/FixJ family response regulator